MTQNDYVPQPSLHCQTQQGLGNPMTRQRVSNKISGSDVFANTQKSKSGHLNKHQQQHNHGMPAVSDYQIDQPISEQQSNNGNHKKQ